AENKFAKCLMTCLKCCFWCLEKFIKFLNRNAYIMIAIYGTNFCTSARNAFFLLMRNIIRDPGFLLLHPPYQDRAGYSTTPQLLLGSYTDGDRWLLLDCTRFLQRLWHVCGHAVPLLLGGPGEE
ncbi:SLC44A2 isoform 6, partial [Pan troglodytes]